MKSGEAGSKIPNPERWAAVLLLALLCLTSGCATTDSHSAPPSRPFTFDKDTFAYANELVWVYGYDAEGKWTSHRREPKPDYALHCFVVARSALQFFNHARFDPRLPVVDDATYRRLVRRVVSLSPRRRLTEDQRIVIPGYADLRAFSHGHEALLKSECGGAWESYVQRGHWRMIFPFARREQAKMSAQIMTHLRQNGVVVVHLVCFPQLTINHAVIVFGCAEREREIEFTIYDPNAPEAPRTLTYDRASRTFTLPANNYFPGGKVNVYEVYHRWDY